MKIVFAAVAGVTTVLAFSAGTVSGGWMQGRGVSVASIAPRVAPASVVSVASIAPRVSPASVVSVASIPPRVVPAIPVSELNGVVKRYCSGCHNNFTLKGNLSLDGYDVGAAQERLAASEMTIRKLRSGIMQIGRA